MDSGSHSSRLILLLLGLSLLAACSDERSSNVSSYDPATIDSAPARGGRLVDASSGDASNLIPMVAGDAASHAIAGQLYLPLLKTDRNLKLVGLLAKSWDVSPDMLTITFHLRQDVHWTDGKPFTADDCVFTLDLMLDEHTQSPYKSDYLRIASYEAPDAHTFVVHYKEPFSPALFSWAGLSILPAHIFRGVDIMDTPLSRHPKATLGPYSLAGWQEQQSITLHANPDYFDGPVWIDERITRVIPDPATQFLELSAGNLDMMSLNPMQYSRQFDKKPRLKRDFKRYKYLSFGYTYLGFNLKRRKFADRRVREAIAYAIDRQELVDGVLLGLGEVIATPYKPGTPWVNTAVHPRPFDPEKARKLLAEAGWTDHDGDGIVDKNGQPLSFTVLTNNGNKMRADTATIMQQRLKAVGIAIKVRLVEWSAFIENFINKRDFDAVILGWSLTPKPDQYNIWHSSQTGPRQFNFVSYRNDKVDRALVAARRTFDTTERKRLYDIVQEEIHKDVPIVFLYAAYSLPVVHRRILGIEPAPAGIGYNSEQWYVPKAWQQTRDSIAP